MSVTDAEQVAVLLDVVFVAQTCCTNQCLSVMHQTPLQMAQPLVQH